MQQSLSIGQCATLACLLEVAAPKPGNVHRGADFEDLTFGDFLVSATAIAPAMEAASRRGVGPTVLAAIQATHQWVATNSNLGTVLLLAPLATVAPSETLQCGIAEVLRGLTARDSLCVYQAIRVAKPGGLGTVRSMDVATGAPDDLLQAMAAAADRDMVARQYDNQFATVLREIVQWLSTGLEQGWALSDSIVHCQLQLISRYGDSLIARKCGQAQSREAADRAATVLESGRPGDPKYFRALSDLDFWMRTDHHHRNPGTTADLIAAGLFVALRDQVLPLPLRAFATLSGPENNSASKQKGIQ